MNPETHLDAAAYLPKLLNPNPAIGYRVDQFNCILDKHYDWADIQPQPIVEWAG
jgi:hypothetical protein